MKRHIHIIILLIISTVFIFLFYGKAVVNSNNLLFSNSGDAIKNYFTYAYHIKHDSSYLNFEGMNYPFGEHFLYTDCHPVLANTFKLLSSVFPFFNSHSIGFLNFIMIFSIFLTFIFCYYLLLEFKINKWLSILFSIGITLLAPQIFRLEGHLSLSYSMAIPLSWFLLIKCFKNQDKHIYTFLLFINNLFWMFVHAYLGVIILSFLIAMLKVKIIAEKNRSSYIVKYIVQAAALFLPIIIFYLLTIFTDHHIGRTNNPSGFFLHNAELDDIFLPHHGLYRHVLDNLTGHIIKLKWEAWSYVSLSTTILFLVLLILSVIKLFNRKKDLGLNRCFHDKTLNISLIAAFIVLLFAMSFPFKQIPSLIEYFPILKQFRATGRFTWPFYFVAMVFSASVFNDIFFKLINQNKKLFAILFIFVITALNIFEALPYHFQVSKSITKSQNLFKENLLPEKYKNALTHIHPEEFQAILTLPFFYIGSESYSRPRNEDAVRTSIVIAYHTGIPITGAVLTRTSVNESKKIVQLVSPDFYEKEIINDFLNSKPLLVVKIPATLTKYENDLLRKSKQIFSGNDIELFSLDLEDLFRNSGQVIYNQFRQKMPTLFKRDSFYISDSASFLFYKGFENLKSDKIFRGNGAFESIKKGKNIYAEFNPGTFSEDKEYNVSLWMYNGEADALNLWFRFIIEEYDETNNKWYSTTIFPEFSETINGDWSLIEGVFKVNSSKNRIYIISKGKENSKASLFADDLLIQEAGTNVYRLEEDDRLLFYNNHRIRL